MRIAIDSVIIKKRVRKETGELNGLVESMKKYGQLNPIVINRKNELLAGYRRLEAARLLGWNSVYAIVVDKNEAEGMLAIELDENVQRLNLSSEEIAEGFARLEKLRNPGLLGRIWNCIKRFFRRIFGRR